MNIDRNHWMYKVAYGCSRPANRPVRTSLCAFFWTFVFSLLIVWPILLTLAAVMVIMVSVVGIMVGHRIDVYNEKEISKPIERWPEIKGHRVWPITVLAVPLALCGVYWVLELVWSCLTVNNLKLTAIVLATVVAIITVVVTALWIKKYWHTSETLKIVRAWFRAKKEKVCPIVTFVEKS